MGTSTGYGLPTSGNWPSVKRETTLLGKAGTVGTGGAAKLMSHYTQAHGGSRQAALQMSTASRTGARLGGFLAGVQRGGLTQALTDANLGRLIGQAASDVLRGLTDFLIGPGSLLEEDIVRRALLDYQEEAFGACDSYEELDEAFSQLVHRQGIGIVLKKFFGFCVFRRFRVHVAERLMKAASSIRAFKRLVDDVRSFIFAKLDVRTHNRDLMTVDWRGPEGNEFSQEILASVWRVFGGA